MRMLSLLAVGLLAGTGAEAQQSKKKRRIAVPRDSFYLVQTKTLEGKPVRLADYVGQVALVVNLASQ